MKLFTSIFFICSILLMSAFTVPQAQLLTDSVKAPSLQISKAHAFVEPFISLEKGYPFIAHWAIFLMCIWLLAVIVYLIWAIIRYAHNFGLTSEEWKILNPEAFARKPGEYDKYVQIRSQIIDRSKKEFEILNPGKQFDGTIPSFVMPSRNPYYKDSFGLPPGTIRGILAITSMFAFVLIECANLFSPANLERDFSELLMVFQMVIAFYFGARAVEVFKKKQDTKSNDEEMSTPSDTPSTKIEKVSTSKSITEEVQPEIKPVKTASPVPVEKFELPAEKAIVPEDKVILRQQNIQPVTISTELISKAFNKSILSLEQKILGLTASFETSIGFPECFGVVTGNFDGQGISFGALQWCIGQNSLQGLFQTMLSEHPKITEKVFTKDQFSQFKAMLQGTMTDQMNWAKSIQITERRPNNSLKWVIIPEWKGALHRLGLTEEMIAIQTAAASVRFAKSRSNCDIYNLRSERGLALMFDINVQNGHLDVNGAGAKIMNDFQALAASLSDDEQEVEKMRIIARRRAEVAKPQYVGDVLKRKMTIAEGDGVVHGKKYSLASDYDITLRPWNTELISEKKLVAV